MAPQLELVPRERIELSTSPLPRVRSTTELPRLIPESGASSPALRGMEARSVRHRALLAFGALGGSTADGPIPDMPNKPPPKSREQRLAEALKRNIGRRKAAKQPPPKK